MLLPKQHVDAGVDGRVGDELLDQARLDGRVVHVELDDDIRRPVRWLHNRAVALGLAARGDAVGRSKVVGGEGAVNCCARGRRWQGSLLGDLGGSGALGCIGDRGLRSVAAGLDRILPRDEHLDVDVAFVEREVLELLDDLQARLLPHLAERHKITRQELCGVDSAVAVWIVCRWWGNGSKASHSRLASESRWDSSRKFSGSKSCWPVLVLPPQR